MAGQAAPNFKQKSVDMPKIVVKLVKMFHDFENLKRRNQQ
jgi:hypothetical protein